VVILVDGDKGKVVVEKAEELPSETHLIGEILTEKYGAESKKSVSVVSAGPGAEHTRFGCLNFSWYDTQRKMVRYKQAARGGIGTVLRDKKIKAIVANFLIYVQISIIPHTLNSLNKLALHTTKKSEH